MKTSMSFALLVLAALTVHPAGSTASAMSVSCRDKYVRMKDHQDVAEAVVAIHSRDGKVALLLTDQAVAFQLSDRTLRKVRRELRDKKEEQDNWLAAAIVTAVAGTVNELIDSSVQCRVRDLRDVSYENGRLVFTARNGRRVFEDIEVDDSDVTASFSERDARKFVREFRRVKFSGD